MGVLGYDSGFMKGPNCKWNEKGRWGQTSCYVPEIELENGGSL